MDLVDFDNVKAEKAKAMQRYNRLRSIGRLFRVAELLLVVLLLSWTLFHLPFAFRISGEFFRRITSVVSSHLFIFLLGNSIIVGLVAKSNIFSSENTSAAAETEFYEAFVRSGDNRTRQLQEEKEDEPEEIIFHDKQVIVTEPDTKPLPKDAVFETESVSDHETGLDIPKAYRRSKSEVICKRPEELGRKALLRRSETEKYREIQIGEERFFNPEDELSNEEFQKTIEAFIAKQLMFRRRESLSVVVSNDG